MQIEAVDFYYLSMPEVLDIGDGSQDVLLVRVQAGAYVGWGECEASPLVSIASLVCPMSHSACKPVRDFGARSDASTTLQISTASAISCAPTASICCRPTTPFPGSTSPCGICSGAAMRLPIYQLLGYPRADPRRPTRHCSSATLRRRRWRRRAGSARLATAPPSSAGGRSGGQPSRTTSRSCGPPARALGEEGMSLIDAGTVWGEDVEAAAERCRRAARV